MQRARRLKRSRPDSRVWTVVATVTPLFAALWLRTLDIRYLAALAAATLLGAALARALPRGTRSWAVAGAIAGGLLCTSAAVDRQALSNIESAWPSYRDALVSQGISRLEASLARTATELTSLAASALDAADDPGNAHAILGRTARTGGGRGVVLLDGSRPIAWAGRVFVPPESLAVVRPLRVVTDPFHLTLYALASNGNLRGVAAEVIHVEPPANRLTPSLGERIARSSGLKQFEFAEPSAASVSPGWVAYAPFGDTLFAVRAVAPGQEEARLQAQETARLSGTILLVVLLVLVTAASWRGPKSLPWRLLPLAVWCGCLAIVPLNTFSTAALLFDPTVYFTPRGGFFTSSVGALGLSGALVSLAVLIALRSHARLPSRLLAAAIVLVIMATGPFLLRELSRGITPLQGGVPTRLWLAWELALFLSAASLLVTAAAAGGMALGASRGLAPSVAPALATIAALAGPVVWMAPGRWPAWYPALWIAAIGALALTRRHRAAVLTAASVAALGAATLAWNAGIRGRVTLANRDVSSLAIVEPHVISALERFADSLSERTGRTPPRTEADLLRAYVRSDLAGTEFPVQLQVWTADDSTAAEMELAQFDPPASEVEDLIADVRETGAWEVRSVDGALGRDAILGVPHSDGSVTVVIVAPRTRLIPEDPYNVLLGLESRDVGRSPYLLTLASLEPATPASPRPLRVEWYRAGNELHSDRLVNTAAGPARAHIEIALRSLESLVPRGTLVVLLDLVIIMALWLLSAYPDGALYRWMRARLRGWTTSYRSRLTLVLFAFFVIPAVASAVWSYRSAMSQDLESHALLVRQYLRAITTGSDEERLLSGTNQIGAPLLLYRNGVLREASKPIYQDLAPMGRYLSAPVYRNLVQAQEVQASSLEKLGAEDVLFGYRLASTSRGDQAVVAAPARRDEETLGQRNDDLSILVLFATVIGALAALWLSGIAARSLAEPIGSLRGAALAIAAGEREPVLAGEPPVEFVPVFSAFRRMAADLGESRAALVAAQRRTAAVLRNVASGVVALDRHGSVTLTNPQAEALIGGVIPSGTDIREIEPRELGERVVGFLAADFDDQEFDMEVDGRQLHARLTRLAAGGGGGVLTLDDVTQMARAQRVLAWGEMARQVAHEIKNPLTPIRLGVQHLKRARADDRGDFDEILDRNVHRILLEIDHLDEIARSFSRYGTVPGERLPAEPTDAAAVLRAVLELERLGSDGVEWRFENDMGAPVYVAARSDELREVVLNVLENARHAGARHVSVSLSVADSSVAVVVRDDGSGIAHDVLPRIFEPHFSTRTSGSGLGLAISRQLVEGWGGAITLATGEGEGTTVKIELVREVV